MQCLSPISIVRPHGNGSADRLQVPCGKCAACLSNKRQQWAFRLEQEQKHSESAYFITLTYDDDHLPKIGGIPTVSKEDIQKFFKRLRKRTNKKLRYFLCAEYGPTTYRPHYHAILFNFPCDVDLLAVLLDSWQNGVNLVVGSCTPQSINYCAKYCVTKSDYPEGVLPPFCLMSRRPAIGALYLSPAMVEYHTQDSGNRFYATREGGLRVNLPRYYQDKLFSKEAKEHHLSELAKLHSNLYGVNIDAFTDYRKAFKYVDDVRNDYTRKVLKNAKKDKKL